MEENGNNPCTRKSSHIYIRYVFVKNQVDRNGMSIVYCSIDHMLAYFFTKALQVALFDKVRVVIIGWRHIDNLHMGPP